MVVEHDEDYGSVITRRAMKDLVFRTALLNDPRTTIERTLGIDLPNDVDVCVVEETSRKIFLVLPPVLSTSHTTVENLELDEVAGLSATHVSCCQCSHTAPDTKKECGK